MVRGVITRFMSAAGALVAVRRRRDLRWSPHGARGPAQAAPAKPTTITISGKGMTGKLTVAAARTRRVFQLCSARSAGWPPRRRRPPRPRRTSSARNTS